MNGKDIWTARGRLGDLYDLGRPLKMTELGRILGLKGGDVGATVRDWERGHSPVTGPVSLAVRALLDGWRPPELETYLARERTED